MRVISNVERLSTDKITLTLTLCHEYAGEGMSRAHLPKEFFMPRRRYVDKTCWFDLFDKPYFAGKLRRNFGPVELSGFSAASAVVGPDAVVEIHGHRTGKQAVVRLEPRRVIADLDAVLRGMKIHSAKIHRSGSAAAR